MRLHQRSLLPWRSMKNTNSSFTSNLNHQPHSALQVTPEPQLGKCEPKPLVPPGIRTTAREYANPVDYKHPYPSMAQFADLLALRYDAEPINRQTGPSMGRDACNRRDWHTREPWSECRVERVA